MMPPLNYYRRYLFSSFWETAVAVVGFVPSGGAVVPSSCLFDLIVNGRDVHPSTIALPSRQPRKEGGCK